ncbi:ATP-binding protein [Nodosilinea sp. LEGE 07088]|uniref:ATP-binding protein n=1 Tax=Nodosilinea sp. LEGE 07088 TaxID=2777968 RepID=UPI00187F46EB|nr:ATP-binding protein [Nodosilinea sp. LEGE 07088]MBE9137368.1 ATP-binding protein [Nodosilinea sp. LEGE 07088]
MASNDYDIVPAHLAVQAMRDNGYKNAAYAIAELMDNAIQAGATSLELLCGEKEHLGGQRKRMRISEIAVLDSGSGMDHDTLRLALQFGNGTYLDEDKHTGIGRFGMGLPCSSISQCQRVDVWTWQDGVANALHSFLDLSDIKARQQTEVPEPVPKAIPGLWLEVGKSFGNSGTLVVWSKIDRCMWKTSKTIIDNSELLIGRIYRRFVEGKKVAIRMMSFDVDKPDQPLIDKLIQPNDPGYLMNQTSCPEPYDDIPMFDLFGSEANIVIGFRGQEHTVKIKVSVAKEEARQGHNPGSRPYGQHAKKNIGVSVVRADRELELDQSWVIQYDPVERWWGIEVDFPPSLDDLFGVTNNKQFARNFSELADIDLDSLTKGRTIVEVREELEDEEDPRAPLLELANRISKNLSVLRKAIRDQTQGSKRQERQRHAPPVAEAKATQATKKRQEEGHQGETDRDETKTPEERKRVIEEILEQSGIAKEVANTLAATTVDSGLKYIFAESSLETSAFFTVKLKGGSIEILLNTNHPAYGKLIEVLEQDVEGVEADELKQRLKNSLEGLKLLLMSWARYEDEQPEGKRRTQAQDTRADWGRVAREFLDGDD